MNAPVPTIHDPSSLPDRAPWGGDVGRGPVRGTGRGAGGAGWAGGATDLHRYAQVLRQRWRLLAAVFVAVVAAVAIGTLLQTRVYRATGLLELRGQTGEGVPVEALLQASRLSNQFLGTQYGVLRSRALAKRVMTDVGLLPPGAPAADPAVMRRIDSFTRHLKVDPVVGSNLVRVRYEASDPALAARIVNAVFASYATMRTETARAAVARLVGAADSARERLTRGERALQDYARANGIAHVPGGRGVPDGLPDERLRILRQQLAEAEADRYAKESFYDLARTQGDGLLESEILQALSVRLAALRGEHAKLQSLFLPDYPRTRELKGQIDEVEAQIRREKARLRDGAAGRYRAAVQREELLQRAAEGERTRVDQQGERTTQYRILARDVEAQQELYAKLQERVRAAEVSAAVASTDVSVVEAAVVPTDPVRPVLGDNLRLAMLVGLVLGLGAVVLREYTDLTVRRVDELDALAVPVLGLIPSVAGRTALLATSSGAARSRRLPSRLGGERAPGAPPILRFDLPDARTPRREVLADAFGGLRTAVLFSNGERRTPQTLLVTSVQPGDGKTTVAVNLAVSLARLGRRVLLVDADTRRPSAHRSFGVPREGGLGDFLRDEAPWTELVRPQVAPGLDLLPAGGPFETSSEAFASDRPGSLLDEARQAYDYVVLDSPALHISASDTRLLSALVDGVVLVVRSGTTPRTLVGSVLRHVPNVVGVVLNDVDPHDLPTYYRDAQAAQAARGAAP